MAYIRSKQSIQFFVLALLTTAFFTISYNLGMLIWEDRPQTWVQSLEVVVQSFTTTGYGQDAPWETTQMNVLVIGMQLAGIGLILAAINAFVVPWIRARFRPSAPRNRIDIEDHVVICGYTARTESFATELQGRNRKCAIVERDEELATQLHEGGMQVVCGDPESVETLELAGLDRAAAVVADEADDVNASIVLSVRERDPDVPVITVLEDRELDEYHRIAGADHVCLPRQLLGESLAQSIPTAITPTMDESVAISEDVGIVELTVGEGSSICGRHLGDLDLTERYGVAVLGAWIESDFVTPVDPDFHIEPSTRLLIAGDPDGIEELRTGGILAVRDLVPRSVVIAGFGESGQAAAQAFEDSRTHVTVLDEADSPGVDIVGDSRDPNTLQQAGIQDASALIVTVGDDTTAIFTTLVAKDLNPDIGVYARANHEENVPKLVRAGADEVQSLASISGRMLASTIFEGEIPVAMDREIHVIATPVRELAAERIADIHGRTGMRVLAVIRDDEALTHFDPSTFEFEADDDLILAGSSEQLETFEQTFE